MFTNHMARSASTISLSILVVIEMLNACNALSQSESLLTLPVWKNMKLVYAIILSMVLHFGILYIPFLQSLFQVSPMTLQEWKAVLYISVPVMYALIAQDLNQIRWIDEVLKFLERQMTVSTVSTLDKTLKQKGL
jgi:P-type Ca2+ transporter type 2A